METANKQNDNKLAQMALEIAKGQIGQHEIPKGSNSGPMVDVYLKAVGLNPGFPWCQAFVNYCYELAANQLAVPEPVPNTGGVLDCWNKVKMSQKLFSVEANQRPRLVQPGMQFILKLGDTVGHTGIVERMEEVKPNEWVIHTIEGNTDDEGGREGWEVARRQRRINSKGLLGFIRYDGSAGLTMTKI